MDILMRKIANCGA